ncbi:MAG TPA: hypothetical protein VFX16_10375 [Pseudonocardiaceae bacterium]|nr:hypothetical protein [Pseudonocardiaceae bacterium]
MTLVLAGRLQTRLFVVATVGVLWTVMLTPLLPVPPGTGIGGAYRMTFENLGLMAGLGLLWELVYHLLQQVRWDKDWPTLLGLLTVVNEAIPLWFLDHWLHVLPGTAGFAAPSLPAFTVHIGTTWLVMWLFLQGPVRVLHLRWRFEGGRVLRRARGRRHRTDEWLETQWLESLRSSDQPHQLAVMAGGLGDVVELPRGEPLTDRLVTGALCPNGHFGNADAPYCATCGAAVPPQPPVLGTRPPVGVLITVDGATRILDGDLSVMVTDDVLEFRGDGDAESSGLVLADIRIVGWQPVVSSATGPVVVLLPNGTRLGAAVDVPVPVVPGSALVLGKHVVRYDSPYAIDVDPAERRDLAAARVVAPAGRATSPAVRRVAAAAAIAVLAGAVAFAIVDRSGDGERRAGIRPPVVIPPPLSSFSVPPWTLPSQTSGATSPLLPILPTGRLSLPPLPLPLPNPTLGSLPPIGTLPPVPTSPGGGTTTSPAPTSPAPPPSSSPAPVSSVPTAALCAVDILGLAQCAMGLLGGG